MAGRDTQVVEGVHEGELALLGQLERAGVGLVVDVASEHDLSSERFGALHLDIGGRCGHDDGGGHAVALRRVGHALRMVAGRRGDEAAFALVVGKRADLVVCATHLIGAGALHVLRLEEDAIARDLAEVRALDELGLLGDLANFVGRLLEGGQGEHFLSFVRHRFSLHFSMVHKRPSL